MHVQDSGGSVSSDVMRAVGVVSGQTGVTGQPVRRSVGKNIVENVVPGYHAVQTKPGEWELVKAPTPGGPVPGELEYGEPFALGDGRFAVKTGEDDYEIVTPGGGQWFVDAWGNGYIQDASGKLNPVEAPTVEEQINQALVQGNAEKAMALADFRDRPSAEERMRLAMEFARTPGDLMAISAILRGQLEPPPPPKPGETQRVAAPPDWVVDAWKDLTSAWGVEEGLGSVLPGVTPEAAAATGIGKGDLSQVGYAQDFSEKANQEVIDNMFASAEEIAGKGRATGREEDIDLFPQIREDFRKSQEPPISPRRINQNVDQLGAGDTFTPMVAETPNTEEIARQQALDAQRAAEAAAHRAQEEAIWKESKPVGSNPRDELGRTISRALGSTISDFELKKIVDDATAGRAVHPGVLAHAQDELARREAEGSWTNPGMRTTIPYATDYAEQLAKTVVTRPDPVTGRPRDPNVVFGGADPNIPGYGGETDPSELGPAHLTTEDMQAPLPELTPREQAAERVRFAEMGWRSSGNPLYQPEPFDEEVDYSPERRRDPEPFDEEFDLFAEGGPVFRDAMALVGEEGPELVRLPEGAEVIPADFTEAMLEGRKPLKMQYGGMVQIGGTGGQMVRESDLETLRRGAALDKTTSEMMGTDVSQFDLPPSGRRPAQYVERRAPDPPPQDWWRTPSNAVLPSAPSGRPISVAVPAPIS